MGSKVEERVQELRDLERSPAWQLCREEIQAQMVRTKNKMLVSSREGVSSSHHIGGYEMAEILLNLPQIVIEKMTEREEDDGR